MAATFACPFQEEVTQIGKLASFSNHTYCILSSFCFLFFHVIQFHSLTLLILLIIMLPPHKSNTNFPASPCMPITCQNLPKHFFSHLLITYTHLKLHLSKFYYKFKFIISFCSSAFQNAHILKNLHLFNSNKLLIPLKITIASFFTFFFL